MADAPRLRARVSAHAKVNLDLRILAREASGWHQLETIFQRISLCDDVEVQVGGDGDAITVHCAPPVDVAMHDNLAWKAAAAYQQVAAWPASGTAITITITKRIPTGGGLGGGSADAGAVLRAMNALSPAPLATFALLAIAGSLGADVPFLSTDAATALAWGRGERMLHLDAPPVRQVHCALFREGVNTAAAYRALSADRESGAVARHLGTLRTAGDCASWESLRTDAVNDFEGPVFRLRPDIAAVHAAWCAAAPDALVRMSGSGATVFAVSTGDSAPLVAALRALPVDGVHVVSAATLAHVPPITILSPDSGAR